MQVFHTNINFHWSLTDSKSPQVSRTFLSILADLSNAVVCMVLICPLISNFSSLLSNPLGIVPGATIAIGITIIIIIIIYLKP